MMARKPMREKLICQKAVARRKATIRAKISFSLNPPFLFLNNSLVRKYVPKTVRIPKIVLGKRSAHGSLPKRATEKLWMLINNPSRPLFSG